MSFNTPAKGTELIFVSSEDPSVDWERAEREHGLTKDAYKEDPTEEAAQKLCPKAGEELTVFHLSFPTSQQIDAAQGSPSGQEAVALAVQCIQSADALFRGGKPVKIKRLASGRLDADSMAAIQWAVLVQIGYFLLSVGSGISRPLGN